MSKKGFGKFVLGAGIGAALGVLFAPKKGSDTRADIKKAFDDMMTKLQSMDSDEVKELVEAKVLELQEGIENLNAETVLAEAKKQAKKLKKQAEELVEYAIEQGTPVIEKSAVAIKDKVAEVSDEVIANLSQSKK